MFWKNDKMMKVVVEEKHNWGFCIWGDRRHSDQWPISNCPHLALQETPGCGEVQESLEGDSLSCKGQICEGGNPFWGFYIPLGKPSYPLLLLLCYGCFIFKFQILDLI